MREREREKEDEREIPSLFQSPNGQRNQGWHRPKSGTSSVCVFPTWWQESKLLGHFQGFLWHISRKLDWLWCSQILNMHMDVGWRH